MPIISLSGFLAMREITTPKSEFVNDKLIFQNIYIHAYLANRAWVDCWMWLHIYYIAAAAGVIYIIIKRRIDA